MRTLSTAAALVVLLKGDSVNAELECKSGSLYGTAKGWVLGDSSKCWAEAMNAAFPGLKLGGCYYGGNHLYISDSSNLTAINGHPGYKGLPIGDYSVVSVF